MTAKRTFAILAACLAHVAAIGETHWLYNGSTLITEQDVEPGARGWVLKVSSSGTGLLQCTGVQTAGTNVAGSATSRRLLDMDAPIRNLGGAEFKINKFSEGLFNDSTAVDTIILPSELVAIPKNALRGSKSTLKRVFVTGSKITTIGQYAFYQNTSITNITPMVFDGLTKIENGAFQGCTNLRGDFIVNSDSLTLSGGSYGTFQNCKSLHGFIVNGDVVGAIPEKCFHTCSSLAQVRLSRNPTNIVTSVGLFAFYDCLALSSFAPMRFSKATFIGDGAFHNCSNLPGDFIVESGTLSLGTSANSYGAFYNCSKLTSFINRGDITGTLPVRCFYGCSKLGEVQLTSNSVCKLTSLASTSVYNCSSLTNLHPLVFDRLTSIGKQALDESRNIRGDFIIAYDNPVSIGEEALGWDAGKYTCFVVRGPVSSISSRFLQGCTTVTNVYFGSTVASPGNCFLYGCTALRLLHMPFRPASFGGSYSFGNISARQMVICASYRDTGANGWLNPANYTPWNELSASVRQEWTSLSAATKEARGWSSFRRPAGVTLGLVNNQWLVTLSDAGTKLILR